MVDRDAVEPGAQRGLASKLVHLAEGLEEDVVRGVALGPEHVVKPEPGRLVLFPSYMWHGTVPFDGDAPRLTVAFDLVPARKG